MSGTDMTTAGGSGAASETPERASGAFHLMPAKAKSHRLMPGESLWDVLHIVNPPFFNSNSPSIQLVDLRSENLPNRSQLIDAGAHFYMDEFNRAGGRAGVTNYWTYDLAKIQLEKRLQQPGVGHLLLQGGQVTAAFLAELAPGPNGPRGVELDVIVDENRHRQGIGSRLVLNAFNELARLAKDLYRTPLVAIEAETYQMGWQQQVWKRIGFNHDMLLSATIDSSRASEDLGGVKVSKLELSHLPTLLELNLHTKRLSSSLEQPWDRARFPAFIESLEQHLKTVASPIMYVAETPKGEIAAFFSAHPTIRRNGQVVLTSPYTIISESAFRNEDHQSRTIREFFRRAAEDALNDARSFGIKLGPVTNVEYGTISNAAFFNRLGIGPTKLDDKFYGIKIDDLENAQNQLLKRVLGKDPEAPVYRLIGIKSPRRRRGVISQNG